MLEELERFLPEHRKQTVHCLHFKANCTTHKNRARGKYSPLFPDKTSIIHNPKWIFFPFPFWEKRPDLIVSPIWCTFTVRKNEFSFPYMCQIMTSGRKKNLHFQKPHASSHWLCHAQHQTPKPTRIQYKLFTGYTFQRDKYKYYKMNGITFKIHVFV